jgi:hypothetical protein
MRVEFHAPEEEVARWKEEAHTLGLSLSALVRSRMNGASAGLDLDLRARVAKLEARLESHRPEESRREPKPRTEQPAQPPATPSPPSPPFVTEEIRPDPPRPNPSRLPVEAAKTTAKTSTLKPAERARLRGQCSQNMYFWHSTPGDVPCPECGKLTHGPE